MTLKINVSYLDGNINDLSTGLERSGDAVGKWLQQQTTDEALAAIPTVFSICGRSHDVAARLALGELTDTDAAQQLAHKAVIESIREYVIRLLQHWDYPIDRPALGQWMQAVNEDTLTPAELARQVQALLPDAQQTADWLSNIQQIWQRQFGDVQLNTEQLNKEQLQTYFQWSPQAPGADVNFYAGTGADVLASHNSTLDQVLAEVIRQMLSDMNYLIGRLTGEMTGYALIQHCLREDDQGQHSEGWVRTSRGWLCHRITTHGNDREWQVISPTDINFASANSLLNTLLSATPSAPEAVESVVAATVKAIDPCVEFTITVNGTSSGERHA